MMRDPVITNPGLDNSMICENEPVRMPGYRDVPGARTTPRRHPDSIMYALSSFHRRLICIH